MSAPDTTDPAVAAAEAELARLRAEAEAAEAQLKAAQARAALAAAEAEAAKARRRCGRPASARRPAVAEPVERRSQRPTPDELGDRDRAATVPRPLADSRRRARAATRRPAR